MATTKILMVCLGNICRSPLAEGILKSKLADDIEVDSAGTSAHHEGEKPDPRSIRVAKKHGIDISNQRSRPFKTKDFDIFDNIYVMDSENYENVLKISPSPEASKKVKMILNSIAPQSNAEVPDPYYGGDGGFEHVFQLLDEACEQIVKDLK